GENRLGARDLAVAETERLEKRDRVGPLERGAHLAPVGQQIAVPLVGVVEEPAPDRDPALLVDDDEVAADALVDAVDAELELLAAARADRGRVAAGGAGRRGSGR